MGIRFECPNGHRLHVKAFLAGKRGICPECDARFIVPAASGGQAVAVANGAAEAFSPVAALTPAPPLPEVKLSISAPKLRRTVRDRRLQRAKAATMALSALVFLLLVALVLVLVR